MLLEVEKTLIKRWDGIDGRNEKFAPYNIDLNCTNNDCRRSLVNCSLRWTDALDFSHTSVRCASCGEYMRFFLIDTPKSIQPEDLNKCRILVIPPRSIPIDFSPDIQRLSPQFIKIYKQASESELLNLDELAGMGYRKALEFLIKDYLVSTHADKADAIKKKFLNQCINEYVENYNIKSCAERAAWLGNDESHYIRKWEEHDIEDFKILLKLTVDFIDDNLLVKKFVGSMSAKNGRASQ